MRYGTVRTVRYVMVLNDTVPSGTLWHGMYMIIL